MKVNNESCINMVWATYIVKNLGSVIARKNPRDLGPQLDAQQVLSQGLERGMYLEATYLFLIIFIKIIK